MSASSRSFFAGIDSDGCVFDTMEIKQKRCFHPAIIAHWRLQAIAPLVRETAEFVNLYSCWRGRNRYINLLLLMDMLRRRPESGAAGAAIPELADLREWAAGPGPLSAADLRRAARVSGSRELASVLEWSEGVDRAIGALPADNGAPFPWARECLEKIRRAADAAVISQTPAGALRREWRAHRLEHTVTAILGQEAGSKTEQLAAAIRDRYDGKHALMIGDAPGDAEAAGANAVLFYPIAPGAEAASWERLYREAFDLFLRGGYAGEYAGNLLRDFRQRLPAVPPWAPNREKPHDCFI